MPSPGTHSLPVSTEDQSHQCVDSVSARVFGLYESKEKRGGVDQQGDSEFSCALFVIVRKRVKAIFQSSNVENASPLESEAYKR